MKSMIAVIQAGGLGTRMQNLTQNRIPKPMLLLNGKTLLEWQLDEIKKNDINEVVFIIGHLGEQIKSYFGNGGRWGMRIKYVEESQPLGSGGSLYWLKDYPAEDYLFIYGDVMFDIDIQRLIDYHRKKDAVITLVAHPNAHPFDSDLLLTDKNESVTGILRKNEKKDRCYHNLVNSGISIFSSRVLDGLTPKTRVDWEHDIVSKWISRGGVFAYRTPEYIKDVGTPDRFRKTAQEQQRGLWTKKNLSHKQKCIFLDRDGTINEFVGFITKPAQISLYPKTAEAIRLINSSGFLAIVITNQPVVARGMCTEEDVGLIHARMEVLLGQEKAYLDDILFCPHHPDKGYPEENSNYKIKCGCRKPAIGMIKKVEEKYNIALSESYFVGDTTGDIQTGINAGLHTVLLLTGESGKDGKYDVEPEMVAENLLSAVKQILKREVSDHGLYEGNKRLY